MRASSMYRLLLLLCSLAVADAVKCDISLVNGVTPEEVTFEPLSENNATKRLACRSENAYRVIVFNSLRLKEINCNEEQGWWKGENVIAKADSPLLVSCEEELKCDISLIKGVAPEEITFEYDRNVHGQALACRDNKNGSQKAVMVNSSKYHQMFCKEGSGWSTELGKVISETVIPLTVSCAVRCDVSLIKGVEPEEIIFAYDGSRYKHIYCRSSENNLKMIKVNSKTAYTIKCDEEKGWAGIEQIADAYSPITISCKEYCAVTGTGLVIDKHFTSASPVNNDMRATTKVIAKCSPQLVSPQMFYGGQKVEENTASCDILNNWSMKGNPDKSTPIQLECRTADPCASSARQFGENLSYLSEAKTLECAGNSTSLEAIKVNSEHYESLKCNDVIGWIGGNSYIASISSSLNASCVKYCEATGSGIQVEQDRDTIIVFCSDPAFKLFYGDTHVRRHASCKMDGWKMQFNESMDREGDAFTPQQFECRADSTTTLPPDASTPAPSADNIDKDGFRFFEEHKTFIMMTGCAVGGLIIGIIAGLMIFKVCCAKNERKDDTETRRRSETTGVRKADRVDRRSSQSRGTDESRALNDVASGSSEH